MKIRAVIIDEKNSISDGYITHEFSYSYCFSVNGKLYKEDSQSEKFKVGDSILIEYYPRWPVLNRPIK